MKNIWYLPTILILACAFTACSINIPWDIMDDYDGVRVVMHVVPDDADVLLNGRFIGVAYEFTSPGLALRLASRQNELTFRKKGFHESVVDLRDYSSRNITLKVELENETVLAGSPGSTTTPNPPEGQQAYEAKTEPLPPQPVEKPVPLQEHFLTLVALTVIPEETAIYIDSRFWGVSPAAGKPIFLRLPPGKHTFTVFSPGFKTFSKEITVPKQEKFELGITLQK